MTTEEFRVKFSQGVAEDDFLLCVPDEYGVCILTNDGLDNLTNIAEVAAEPLFQRIAELEKPIDMIIFCPNCYFKHIDQPQPEKNWDNPPHRSHECQSCGTVWRPADVNTNGVVAIQTRGQRDTV
jgi:hypothetical protein